MKARTRYITLTFILLFLFFAYRRQRLRNYASYANAPHFISKEALYNRPLSLIRDWPLKISECTMAECFDLSRCLSQDFRVYVYPSDNETATSVVYHNILKAIKESVYYTDDPSKACVFVLSIDTVDRDRRSENYVKYVNELIAALPPAVWNSGRNHIIFNLYHGTYPDYSDHDLGFDVGYAIIARASANAQMFREGFDLSFPLFHKQHPLRTTVEAEWPLRLNDKHLVSFKGKRYVYGIGSETRDSLYHLHNRRAVVMVTTCKHNTDWKKYEDERCEEDNVEYDKWDYEMTMSNSTFCLTPRGRRLGSFRFLEALRLGCIPVIMSDDWVLPFSEIIDWRQAAIIGHEDTVLIISDMLSAVPESQILFMKQQARGLYQRYFSSVEKIALTSLQIVEERIRLQRAEESKEWNRLSTPVNIDLHRFDCTVYLRAGLKPTGRINRVVNFLTSVNRIKKIVIFWPAARGVVSDFSRHKQRVAVKHDDYDAQYETIKYAVDSPQEVVGNFLILLDERVPFTVNDVNALIDAAQWEPERLYGFYGASTEIQNKQHVITVAPSGQYAIVLHHFALVKRDYLFEFRRWVPRPAIEVASKTQQCYALLLTLLVTELSYQSPVLIGNKNHEKWMTSKNYTLCMNKLVPDVWPLGPSLIASQIRFISEEIDSQVTESTTSL